MQITENLEIGKCVRICTKFNFEFVPIFSLKMSVFFRYCDFVRQCDLHTKDTVLGS